MKLALTFALLCSPVFATDAVDLSGEYQLHLESKASLLIPATEQVTEPALLEFTDSMALPGTTDLAHKGPHVTEDKPFGYHLSRQYAHIGPAYYQRSITIPKQWEGGEVELFLERVMWQSRVWIDGKEVGIPQDSLNTPHVHRLGKLSPGTHEIVIRVDNRLIHPIGDMGHGYGAQTQSIWNGVVGKMELRRLAKRHIESVRVFPNLDGTVEIEVHGEFGKNATLQASCSDGRLGQTPPPFLSGVAAEGKTVTLQGQAVTAPAAWSEFNPQTYKLLVTLKDGDQILDAHTSTFGFRTATNEGNKLLINGKPAFMRGNLECAVFPQTGHPPVTVEEWTRIWKIYKDHNFNHARFHSWCPPEAAFIAADNVGIYLQVEAPIWIDGWMTHPNSRPEMDTAGYPQGLGKNDRTIDAFAQSEIRRTLDTYGNHPSFVFFCIGNELGPSNFDVTGTWIRNAKEHDPRRLYAASTARTITPFDDFNATHNIPGIGWVRQHMEFGNDWDYQENYAAADIPIIAHEIGQWPVYVDWQTELPKYTGPLKPYRLEEMAAEAKKSGLYDRAKELQQASGASNRLLYRYEIESFLRTPACRGFQLLSMQDFSGQGEAHVGWLDSFYDSKGTTKLNGFRRYCAPTVPLLRLPGYVFQASDKPEIEALVHHFGQADLRRAIVTWTLTVGDPSDIKTLDHGSLSGKSIAEGTVSSLGKFSPDFSSIQKATAATLTLTVGASVNSYGVWIYPDVIDTESANEVVFTADWQGEAKAALDAGQTVLLDAHLLGGKKASKLAFWMPLYWSVPFFPGQNRDTIGLLVDDRHPAFANFPTVAFADWNWFRICRGAHGYDLTEITANDYRGIAEPVSDFHLNRRLGSIFEFKVGKGKLLVCGYNLSDPNAAQYPEVAQLRRSLLNYVASETFNPQTDLDADLLDPLFENPQIKLATLPERFAAADLYVNAAGKLGVEQQNVPWAKGHDQILRQSSGVDYTTETDGIWRDNQGSAWHGKTIKLKIIPRAGVPGTLYVRLYDWNENGRTGTITFEGKEQIIGPHTDPVWLEFPVIREDTNDAQLILTATALSGPNLMITDIAFMPDED